MSAAYYICCLIFSSILHGEELSIFEIELSGLITSPKQEISGMDWFENRLFLLPENQNGFLFSLEKSEIMIAINNQHSANQKPLTPKQTRLIAPNYKDLIPGFEGFEGISFIKNDVYITIEAENNGIMESYIIWGNIDPRTYELTISRENLKGIETPIQVKNMTYESIVSWNQKIYAIFEANGANLQEHATQKTLSLKNKALSSINFPSIEYRITDATKVDEKGKFWCINYFWPGEKDRLIPGKDSILDGVEEGDTHKKYEHVERLVEYKISGDKIVRTSTPPIQLSLEEKSRNWEGLARVDGKGFLMIVDEHPRTILAFIPKP